LFKGKIKDAITNGIRTAINNAINTNLNEVLKKLPTKYNIQNILLADYSLVDNPRFGDYMVLDIKGEFFDIKNPQEAPFAPGQIPDVQSTNVMVQFTIDQYVADTACFSLWKSGLIHLVVNDSMIPPDFPVRFNTDSFKYIIPALYNQYPSKPLQAIFDPIQSPIVSFKSNGTVEIVAQFQISFYVLLPAPTHVFTIGTNVTFDGKVFMNGSIIVVDLTFGAVRIWLLESDVGPFDVSLLDSLAVLAISEVIPYVNSFFLNKGFPLPNIPGVQFINPYLGYGNQYIFVNTDVRYTPQGNYDNIIEN